MFALNPLPSSIEAYLQEAGFSLTEMLIIRRLFEQDGLTIRELAAKTGKSTGILDQAVKKLLRKNIITREWMNDTNRYALAPLDAIVKWMQEDMRLKKEMLQRKHQNFETFIRTLQLDRTRPEMEFYDGESGIEKAYRRLLGEGKEMLQFVPVLTTAEDDPLRAFRVEYFRERRRLGVFSRILAHDTALGRRYRSRDPFEYRQTILVPKEEFPFTFEKIIAGDIVACFNFSEKRACLIRYPELASVERSLFEQVWRNALKSEKEKEALASDAPSVPVVSLTTRVLSAVREFFLSRKSLVIFGVFAVISAGLTFGFYRYTAWLNLERIREEVRSVAATGALQLQANDINQIHTRADITKPEYAKIIGELNEIRSQNPMVKYMYVLRPTAKKNTFEFVADADSINPDLKKDYNGDGIIDAADEDIAPGKTYDVSDMDILREKKYLSPAANAQPYTDQWGTFVTGYAPVFDTQHHFVAVLGVDIFASKVGELTNEIIAPVYFFIIIFLLFVIIRLAAFNRSLVKEVYDMLQIKKILWSIIICFLLASVATGILYQYTKNLNLHRMQDQVKSIAATGSYQFDATDMDALRVEADWKKPQWAKVVNQLKDIRMHNPDLVFVYIFRKSPHDPHRIEFVADSHSLNPYANTDNNPSNDADADGNGKIEPDGGDKLQWPGQTYPPPNEEVFAAFNGPVATNFYQDSWGKYLSGYAPIKDDSGRSVAVLAVDLKAGRLDELNSQVFAPLLCFVGLFTVLICIRIGAFHPGSLKGLWRFMRTRRMAIFIIICIAIVGIICGMYFYTLNILKEEIGNKLMGIAATGARAFDANDLKQLHIARDMRTDAYQRVFTKLNEIRASSPNIKYAYIMRKTDDPHVFEFVADADSNTNISYSGTDYNFVIPDSNA
ncbi:hypothetical protein HYR82_04245 [Candidatus Peregrinibacteria bacterium]|nr:hypothetical protein [Candidatus Peregrinibacteria bacterium]